MARFLAAIQGSRGEASRLGGVLSGIRAQAQGWDIGVKVFGNGSHDPATPDGDVFSVYVTGGSHDSFYPILLGRAYLDPMSDDPRGVSFEPSEWLVKQCLAFRPDLVKPADESDND